MDWPPKGRTVSLRSSPFVLAHRRLEFFNKSTAQISDENPTEFTPAGPTFGLWGLIYSWQVQSSADETIGLSSSLTLSS